MHILDWNIMFPGFMSFRFVAMVPDPRLDKGFHKLADQVVNSLLDFNPVEWGLPPFEDTNGR